jgi:hypothetical protein
MNDVISSVFPFVMLGGMTVAFSNPNILLTIHVISNNRFYYYCFLILLDSLNIKRSSISLKLLISLMKRRFLIFEIKFCWDR